MIRNYKIENNNSYILTYFFIGLTFYSYQQKVIESGLDFVLVEPNMDFSNNLSKELYDLGKSGINDYESIVSKIQSCDENLFNTIKQKYNRFTELQVQRV